MLIIPKSPLQHRRRPPYAVIVLVLISSLVYLLTARSDSRALENAAEQFTQAGFLEMETPFYLGYLSEREASNRITTFEQSGDTERALRLLQDLGYAEFQRANAQQMVDTWGAGANANHRRIDLWLQQRNSLQAVVGDQSFLAHGLSIQQPSISGFFSYSFVHANSIHLILGMLLLIACGVDLESRMGSARIVTLYLLAQCLGAAAFTLSPAGSHTVLSGSVVPLAALCSVYLIYHWPSSSPFFCWFGPFSGTVPVHAAAPLALLLFLQSGAVLTGFAEPNSFFAILGAIASGIAFYFTAKALDLLQPPEPEQEATTSNGSDYLAALDQIYQLVGNLRIHEARTALDAIVARYGEDFDCAQLRYKLALLENDVTAEGIEALMKKHPQNNRQRTVLAKLWREHPDLHARISDDTLYHVAFELNTPKLLPKAEEIFDQLRARGYHSVALGALANALANSFGNRGHVQKKKTYEQLARSYIAGGADAL
ncbi:MAG: rhomboid family intramembrane serine protease [Spongiibacter sp.]|nr:rhomboid family intramembrane serine protease [Spongiibacter sp.]